MIFSPVVRPPADGEPLSEADIYLLLFSTLDDTGDALRRWLGVEVIPAIRESGGYRLLGVSPHERQRSYRADIPGDVTLSALDAAHHATLWIIAELLPSLVRTGGYCLSGGCPDRSAVGSLAHPPIPPQILDTIQTHAT